MKKVYHWETFGSSTTTGMEVLCPTLSEHILSVLWFLKIFLFQSFYWQLSPPPLYNGDGHLW